MSKAFHAGLDKEERITIQENYMNDKYKCIVATIAFGMGINKSDVRTVIHYGCPQNIESYYQEIGRAGRDGKESNCYLFYKTKDFIIQKKFIEDIQDVQYKKVRADMLNKMSKYIDTKECRRKYILQYFSEETDYKNCKKCDNCLKKKETISKKDEYNLWLILNVIMTIQIEKNYTFGQSTIALILKGSESSKIKPWMKKLEQFGSMKKLSIKDISSFIYKIIDLGYVENYDIGNCCHVLRCTEEGLTFNDSYELLDIEQDLLKNNLLFDI
jgi:RecQ family ATP-dependent DNA helicase